MRAVLQRVTQAEVRVEGEIIGAIKHGWLVLLGIGKGDRQEDLLYICDKIANLRAFNDNEGKFNLALGDVGGEVLVVSQFTLYGDCRKGRRPGFSDAALPADAEALYESCVTHLREMGLKVQTGKFQAHMQLSLTNDGPVTLLLDSQKKF